MNLSCYIVVQGKQPSFGPNRETRRDPGTVRLTKKKPACARDEVALKLNLSIPDSLFVTPTLEASIDVPESQAPREITAEVCENISEVLHQQLGLRIQLSAPSDGSLAQHDGEANDGANQDADQEVRHAEDEAADKTDDKARYPLA